MKTKKLLSCLMALSIVASSSIVLGTTTKAATLSGTNYTATSLTLLLNVKVANSYYSDGTVKNTHVTWDAIPGATKYVLEFDAPISSTVSQTMVYGYEFTKEGIVYVQTPKADGSCYAKMTAYDSNDNIIRSEMYQYKSTANVFTYKTGWIVQ